MRIGLGAQQVFRANLLSRLSPKYMGTHPQGHRLPRTTCLGPTHFHEPGPSPFLDGWARKTTTPKRSGQKTCLTATKAKPQLQSACRIVRITSPTAIQPKTHLFYEFLWCSVHYSKRKISKPYLSQNNPRLRDSATPRLLQTDSSILGFSFRGSDQMCSEYSPSRAYQEERAGVCRDAPSLTPRVPESLDLKSRAWNVFQFSGFCSLGAATGKSWYHTLPRLGKLMLLGKTNSHTSGNQAVWTMFWSIHSRGPPVKFTPKWFRSAIPEVFTVCSLASQSELLQSITTALHGAFFAW